MRTAVLLQCWLSKVPNLNPQQVDDRMERGSYTVFDPAQWAQVCIQIWTPKSFAVLSES